MKTKNNNYNLVLRALRENFPQKKATAIGFRFRANTIEFGNHKRPVAFLNANDERPPHHLLMSGFTWRESPEGFDYWVDIWNNIKPK